MSIWERRKRLCERGFSIHQYDVPPFRVLSIQRRHTVVVSWRWPNGGGHSVVIIRLVSHSIAAALDTLFSRLIRLLHTRKGVHELAVPTPQRGKSWKEIQRISTYQRARPAKLGFKVR